MDLLTKEPGLKNILGEQMQFREHKPRPEGRRRSSRTYQVPTNSSERLYGILGGGRNHWQLQGSKEAPLDAAPVSAQPSAAATSIHLDVRFSIPEALVQCGTLIAEGLSKEQIRTAMRRVPSHHFNAIYNRAPVTKATVEHFLPTQLRQAWTRATLNKIIATNAEVEPKIALAALAQIGKDPEIKLTATTASIVIDGNTLAGLDDLAADCYRDFSQGPPLKTDENS